MDKNKYIEDIKDIKDIMDRSTRFISLSGLSGVAVGVIALFAVYIAYRMGYKIHGQHSFNSSIEPLDSIAIKIILLAIATFITSIIVGALFTYKSSKNKNQSMWNTQAIRMYSSLAIPLVTGGIFCLILFVKGFMALMGPMTLIFYGLALINASKYTLAETRSLGFLEIGLGLAACWFIGYTLIFWAIGFGILHIIYGISMHNKYGA